MCFFFSLFWRPEPVGLQETRRRWAVLRFTQSMLGEVGHDMKLLLPRLFSLPARRKGCASKILRRGGLLFERFAGAVTQAFYNKSQSATIKVFVWFFVVVTRSFTSWTLLTLLFLSSWKLLPGFSVYVLHTCSVIPVVSDAPLADGCRLKAVMFAPSLRLLSPWGSWIVSLCMLNIFCHSDENVLAARFGKCDLKEHISCLCHPLCFMTVEFCGENADMNPSKLTWLFYLSFTLCQDGWQIEVNWGPDSELTKWHQIFFCFPPFLSKVWEGTNLETHCLRLHLFLESPA